MFSNTSSLNSSFNSLRNRCRYLCACESRAASTGAYGLASTIRSSFRLAPTCLRHLPSIPESLRVREWYYGVESLCYSPNQLFSKLQLCQPHPFGTAARNTRRDHGQRHGQNHCWCTQEKGRRVHSSRTQALA